MFVTSGKASIGNFRYEYDPKAIISSARNMTITFCFIVYVTSFSSISVRLLSLHLFLIMVSLSLQFALFKFRLQYERTLDGIAFSLLQAGNNFNHAACSATQFHFTGLELHSIVIHNEEHLFAVNV